MGWCNSNFSHNSNQQKHLVISRQDFSIKLPNYCHFLKWSALRHWVNHSAMDPLITPYPLLLYVVMRASHNNNNRRMSVVCRLGQQNALCCCWVLERLDEMFLGCHFIRYAQSTSTPHPCFGMRDDDPWVKYWRRAIQKR